MRIFVFVWEGELCDLRGWGFDFEEICTILHFCWQHGAEEYIPAIWVIWILAARNVSLLEAGVQMMDGMKMAGMIRYFYDHKGFGFINVTGNPIDIYFQGRQKLRAL